MCGFVVALGNKSVSNEVILRMTDVIHHRGPDKTGFIRFDHKEGDIKIEDNLEQPYLVETDFEISIIPQSEVSLTVSVDNEGNKAYRGGTLEVSGSLEVAVGGTLDNENGIYDDSDYVIGHSYSLEDGYSGTWERDPGKPYGDVNGGAFGRFEVNVKLKYIGSNKKDNVLGGLKRDVLKTKGGKDYIFAGEGNDKIYSGSGKDKVLGGLGNDLIIAGSGNDVITGGLGKDKITGGSGKDIFKLSKGKGYDFIQDFKNKQDKIFIGSAKKLKLKNIGKDVFIYKGKDLLAKAKGAAGDLSIKGKYLV